LSSRTITVGGIASTRTTRAELAAELVDDVRAARTGKRSVPKLVFASNGMVIARYHSDDHFRQMIDQADIIDVDGMPLVFATKLLCKTPLKERVATTDFIRDASAVAVREGIRFYFLGARPDHAKVSAENLARMYPGLQFAGARHGYFSLEEEEAVCADIVNSGADVLWLGLGSPKQEAFALRNRERLSGLAWIRTCGGLFDFYSNFVPRAPIWLQNAGVEWLYRVWQEPTRLGMRYLFTNPAAMYHLLTKTHD
jgi:N-acetylglucosaminyldiphosphoundecaprenol N-acetyl-beta-D-mannosaminyltransferase